MSTPVERTEEDRRKLYEEVVAEMTEAQVRDLLVRQCLDYSDCMRLLSQLSPQALVKHLLSVRVAPEAARMTVLSWGTGQSS